MHHVLPYWCCWLQKSKINRFSGNITFWASFLWFGLVLGELGGFYTMAGLETVNLIWQPSPHMALASRTTGEWLIFLETYVASVTCQSCELIVLQRLCHFWNYHQHVTTLSFKKMSLCPQSDQFFFILSISVPIRICFHKCRLHLLKETPVLAKLPSANINKARKKVFSYQKINLHLAIASLATTLTLVGNMP